MAVYGPYERLSEAPACVQGERVGDIEPWLGMKLPDAKGCLALILGMSMPADWPPPRTAFFFGETKEETVAALRAHLNERAAGKIFVHGQHAMRGFAIDAPKAKYRAAARGWFIPHTVAEAA